MKKSIKNIIGITASLVLFSCNSFLDELPDNRTTLDNEEKIKSILASAYPINSSALITELSSDNTEDLGVDKLNGGRFREEIIYWKHSDEVENDAIKNVWQAHYKAIAASNEALKAIEDLGNPANLAPFKGEALVARAYNYFMLINLFSNHYNTQTSATDLGIPYIEKPETTLIPSYNRSTVKEVYEKINADIETGLPLIRDNVHKTPKYHFNTKAAYAFAARFNLYYEKWEKAVAYATVVLGSSPASAVRDWKALGTLSSNIIVLGNDYVDAARPANLLLLPIISRASSFWGLGNETSPRFVHSIPLSRRETSGARGPWGLTSSNETFWFPIQELANGKTTFYKLPHFVQYTDIVAQTGYLRTVLVPFTADETLLVRAEANIMLKKYADAVQDLNVWSKSFLKAGNTFTQAELENFYGSLPYSTETNLTQKKKLNPKFTIEAGTQENLLHCVLQYRRILTLHEGDRWFDVRRYGIEIFRMQLQSTGNRIVKDKLTTTDLRRTLQLPTEAIKAGVTPNPR